MVSNIFINIRIAFALPYINKLTRLHHTYLIGPTAENDLSIGCLYNHDFSANIVTS